jgi:hypothetical protein
MIALKDFENKESSYASEVITIPNDNITPFLVRNFFGNKPVIVFYYLFIFSILTSSIFNALLKLTITSEFDILITYSTLGFIVGLTFLVFFHEVIQGVIYRLLGAEEIKYFCKPKKLQFYVIANNFKVSKNQFRLISFFPFLMINSFLILALFFSGDEVQYSIYIALLTHSLFCMRDMAVLNFMEKNNFKMTFDRLPENESVFY